MMNKNPFHFDMPDFSPISNCISDIQKQMDIDLEEMNAYREKKDNALFDTAEQLRMMNERLEKESAERSKADKRNFVWVVVAASAGVIATVFAALGYFKW